MESLAVQCSNIPMLILGVRGRPLVVECRGGVGQVSAQRGGRDSVTQQVMMVQIDTDPIRDRHSQPNLELLEMHYSYWLLLLLIQ